MAIDREKTFAAAERLLKLGKAREALDECRRLAEDAPKDLLMLNRVGDLLARSGRGTDAIGYYEKIAEQFSASGFYPKAIAIIKKILKVDPQRTEALVRLGELNLKQKLPGEARAWLLQAADVYLKTRAFTKAREVYEKLVQAEPDNFVHAVRLAEARAAEGDAARAGRDLIALGGRMAAAGRHDDADRTFKRAIDLLPGRAEAVVGLARVHAAAGRRDEALNLADQAWSRLQGAEAVAGDLFLLFEHLGDEARSAALLEDGRADGVDDESIEQACRAAFTQGKSESFWARARVLIDRWARAHQFERAAQLLDRLARVEEGGHLPALERLVELRKAEGVKPTAARAIERLVRAYQGKGRAREVPPLLETLKLFDPNSPLIVVGRPAGTAPAPAAEARPAPVSSPAGPSAKDAARAAALEAPAVPLSPADEEFVSGHLTEAEVFEKYGLHAEALGQLKAVVEKFPGHTLAAERLVGFLRTGGDRAALRGGLLTLGFARRAAGDVEGARKAVSEASQIGGIEPAVQAALERLGLAAPAPAPPRAPAPAPAPPPKPAAASAPVPSSPVTRDQEEELEILFDDAEEAPAPAAADPAAEIREEIEFYIAQGMIQDALARIAGARAQGAASPMLDALEAKARAASSADEGSIAEDKLDEEDLSSIAAALEAEFPGDRAPVAVPAGEPESEQSVDEVFAAFKEHVREQVDGRDYRTHYDLGIAYKEMGLGDDAIAEFRIAAGAPELYREACSMIGLCFWERGEGGEAIRWYRAALDAPADESEPLSGLRYDLAEILLATGDERGALDLFSQVLEIEPAYRDVKNRTEELRARLSR